jgi:hypothetical protein
LALASLRRLRCVFGQLGNIRQAPGRLADIAPQFFVHAAGGNRHVLLDLDLLVLDHRRIGVEINALDRRESLVLAVVAVERLHRHVAGGGRFGVGKNDPSPGHLGAGIGLQDAGPVEFDRTLLVGRDGLPVGSQRGGRAGKNQQRGEGTHAVAHVCFSGEMCGPHMRPDASYFGAAAAKL